MKFLLEVWNNLELYLLYGVIKYYGVEDFEKKINVFKKKLFFFFSAVYLVCFWDDKGL